MSKTRYMPHPADLARIDQMPHVRQVHHSNWYSFARFWWYQILLLDLFLAAWGFYAIFIQGDRNVGVVVVGIALIVVVPADQIAGRIARRAHCTAAVLQRDRLTLLSYGAVREDIALADVVEVEEVSKPGEKPHWLVHTRRRHTVHLKETFEDVETLVRDLRSAAQARAGGDARTGGGAAAR